MKFELYWDLVQMINPIASARSSISITERVRSEILNDGLIMMVS